MFEGAHDEVFDTSGHGSEVVVGCCEEDGIRIKTSTQYNARFQIRNNYVMVFSCSSSSCRYCVHVLYIYIL